MQNEFLENADGSAGRETDAGILERQRRPVTIQPAANQIVGLIIRQRSVFI